MTPRTIGQAIHLCFSEGRSSGSLMVTTSPEGLRQAIAQACGERIITPSSTACPPTRVSSPLSRAGRSCSAVRNRRFCRKNFIHLRCCALGVRFTALGSFLLHQLSQKSACIYSVLRANCAQNQFQKSYMCYF